MTNQQHDDQPRPSSEELRDRIEHTRDDLGRTVEALAAKADVKAQVHEKAADVKAQATETAATVKDQAKDVKAQAKETAATVKEQVSELVKGKTPDPVLDEAGRLATRARANRVPLIAGGAALAAAILLVRRGRRHK